MSGDASVIHNQLTAQLVHAVRTPRSVIFEATATPEMPPQPRPYPQYLSRIAFYDTVQAGELEHRFQLAVQADINGLDIRRAQPVLERTSGEPTIVEREEGDAIRLHLIDWHRKNYTTWHLAINPHDSRLEMTADTEPFSEAGSWQPTPLTAIMGTEKGALSPEQSADATPLELWEEVTTLHSLLRSEPNPDKPAEFADILTYYPQYRLVYPPSPVGKLAQANFEALGELILQDDLLRRWINTAYEDATAA